MSEQYLSSLLDPRTTDKTLSPKIEFLWFLTNLGLKSPKIREDNIFEGMTYECYILLLFDFVFDFQNKKKC